MTLIDDTRAAWNPAPPRGELFAVAPSKRSAFFNHWNGGATGLLDATDHAECLAFVRKIQQWHFDRGWVDIGYNTLVCPHGRVIEGRGLDYIGAHCENWNTAAYGSQLMVGAGEQATALMLNTQRQLYDGLVVRSGALVKYDHRDKMQTDCPGDLIAGWTDDGMPLQEENMEVTKLSTEALQQIARAVQTYPDPYDRSLIQRLSPLGLAMPRLEAAVKALAGELDVDLAKLQASVDAVAAVDAEAVATRVIAKLELQGMVDEKALAGALMDEWTAPPV